MGEARLRFVFPEVRVPLERLIATCGGALYHTWLTLDTSNMQDTLSMSASPMTTPNDCEAFDHALLNGPRLISQPKALVSVCRAAEIGSSRKLLWASDCPQELRILRWGPLLRSQQQHAVMCAAQHQQGSQAHSSHSRADDADGLHQQLQDQEQELQALRLQLRAQETQQAREGERQHRQQPQRPANQELRLELAKVREEAQFKHDAANKRIQQLQDDRDSLAEQAGQLRAEQEQLRRECEDSAHAIAALSEQKEALMKIVEDLHRACADAGLSQAARSSVERGIGSQIL